VRTNATQVFAERGAQPERMDAASQTLLMAGA
jgi:hypothetical protein